MKPESNLMQDPTIVRAQEDAQEINDSVYITNNQKLSKAITAQVQEPHVYLSKNE